MNLSCSEFSKDELFFHFYQTLKYHLILIPELSNGVARLYFSRLFLASKFLLLLFAQEFPVSNFGRKDTVFVFLALLKTSFIELCFFMRRLIY